MTDEELMREALSLCGKNGAHLLYLTRFGSELYGTNTINSDTDAKGVFLPNLDDLILGKAPKNLIYKTSDNGERNTKDDVDINLWSLQYWLELLQKGDTNAIDLLFSYNSPSMIYCVNGLEYMMEENYGKFYSPKNLSAYTGYIIGQAKKYGVKGSRLGVIKRVYEWLDENITVGRLEHFMDAILKECGEPSYCFEKEVNNQRSVILCGKVHQGTIQMDEFRDRIQKDYEGYGERARLAEQNEGIDWKALSHAVRCIHQMTMLLKNGRIVFPLKTSEYLKHIKQGKSLLERR